MCPLYLVKLKSINNWMVIQNEIGIAFSSSLISSFLPRFFTWWDNKWLWSLFDCTKITNQPEPFPFITTQRVEYRVPILVCYDADQPLQHTSLMPCIHKGPHSPYHTPVLFQSSLLTYKIWKTYSKPGFLVFPRIPRCQYISSVVYAWYK